MNKEQCIENQGMRKDDCYFNEVSEKCEAVNAAVPLVIRKT